MTLKQVMAELKKLGTEQTRKTYARHGIPNTFGVKVGDLKTVAKKIKGQQDLACQLYETGNYDAMYLAGIVVDSEQMTRKQLEEWAKSSTCSTLSEYIVAGVAAESRFGRTLAVKWMKSRQELIAISGWATYSGIVSITADGELDLDEIQELLSRVEQKIHSAPDRVRYVMNGFVISVGTYVKPLLKEAKRVAKAIGVVEVDMGDTACKVPLATDYIKKVEGMGRVGKKRKTARC